MKTNVLIFHADLMLSKTVLSAYNRYIYNPTVVTKLEDAIVQLQNQQFGLLVIEVTPPWRYADEPLVKLRAATKTPILALVRGGTTADFRFCMDMADECVWEPFMPDEITARGMRLLQGQSFGQEAAPQQNHIYCRGLMILPQSYKAFVGRTAVQLARKEYVTLLFLAQNCEHLMTHEQIYANVWMEDVVFSVSSAVSGQIHGIRKKLATHTREEYIETVWGVGYRFVNEAKVNTKTNAKA